MKELRVSTHNIFNYCNLQGLKSKSNLHTNVNTAWENYQLKFENLNRVHIKLTLSAASLSFLAAIEGKNEYGNITELRWLRSLHSINLEDNN